MKKLHWMIEIEQDKIENMTLNDLHRIGATIEYMQDTNGWNFKLNISSPNSVVALMSLDYKRNFFRTKMSLTKVNYSTIDSDRTSFNYESDNREYAIALAPIQHMFVTENVDMDMTIDELVLFMSRRSRTKRGFFRLNTYGHQWWPDKKSNLFQVWNLQYWREDKFNRK
jgi:hypothetical protein